MIFCCYDFFIKKRQNFPAPTIAPFVIIGLLLSLVVSTFLMPRYSYGQTSYREASANTAPSTPIENNYNFHEVIKSGHRFFDDVSGLLARGVEAIYRQRGAPSGYIIGEEAGFAFIAGATYGEGTLYLKSKNNTRPYLEYKVFWQGPSLGFDAGVQGSRVMMLVYNLNNIDQLWGRYGGFAANAYLIGGPGINAVYHNNILVIPVKSGIGARLGANFNYLKFTSAPTWNPF